MTEHIVTCPHCGSKNDISKYLNHLKAKMLKEIDKIIDKMKNE